MSIHIITGVQSGELRHTWAKQLAHRHSASTGTVGMWTQATWPWTIITEVPKVGGHQTALEAALTHRLRVLRGQGLWACSPDKMPRWRCCRWSGAHTQGHRRRALCLSLKHEENALGLLFRLQVPSCRLPKYLASLSRTVPSHIDFMSKCLMVLGTGLTLGDL